MAQNSIDHLDFAPEPLVFYNVNKQWVACCFEHTWTYIGVSETLAEIARSSHITHFHGEDPE